jgi:excisionase family DNA binding protein
MAISDLATHEAAYVSVMELAEYWQLDRHQIYKFIDLGGLRALRLGPRTYRIHVKDALRFERDAKLGKVGNPTPRKE